MKNKYICKCGNLDTLAHDTQKQDGFNFSFTLFFYEGKYNFQIPSGESFDIDSCWLCGGLELGDISSKEYHLREFCSCKVIREIIAKETCPIVYSEDRDFYALFFFQDRNIDNLSVLMLFCPFCSGKLFDRKSEHWECEDL